MQGWLGTTETGDRAELELEPSDAFWAELAVGSDRCSGRRCAFHGTCFAEAARDRASSADLVIANHALYFADLAAGGGVLPEHDAVVFDEAHRLEESAASWLGGGVSRAGLRRLALDVERACRERQETLPRAGARPRRARGRAAAARGRAAVGAPAPASSRRARRRSLLGEALGDARDRAAGQRRGARRARPALRCRWRRRSRRCLDPDEQERVVWAEPGAIAWAPVDVSAELRERLWDEGPTAILVSATLTAGEDARFVRRRLGLDRAREAVVGSPYDFGEQALLYLPQAMPDPRSEGFLERAADEIVSLLALSEGRALVLTSSYRALDAYRDSVRGRVPYDVLVQGEAPRERLLERFRDEVGSVLLATSTFWQGVDVAGRVAVAARDRQAAVLGARATRCTRRAARQSSAPAATGSRDYALPTAMLQLRQGFGRLIRGHTDRGVVAILDPRLRTRAYGRAFLAALPRCPIAEDPAAVAAFFGDRCRRFRLNGAPDGEEEPHPDAAAGRPGDRSRERCADDDLGVRHRNAPLRLRGRRASSRSSSWSSRASLSGGGKNTAVRQGRAR